MFEFVSFAHDKAAVAMLDQRRASKHQALLGAGEAEIVVTAVFTETPNLVNHCRPFIRDLYVFNPIMSTPKRLNLTNVSFSGTRRKSRSPRDAYRRHAVRWGGCGARGRICSPLPGGLGIMSPGIMTGVGGASLDWDRRRRVTPVQTTSQEAWPDAEPLGWKQFPLGENRGGTPSDERAPKERAPR